MSGQFVVAVREYKKEQQRFLGAVQRKAGASIRRIKGDATDAEIDAITPIGDEDYDFHDRPCSVEQCSPC